MSQTYSLLEIWGALLSTILATIKIYEIKNEIGKINGFFVKGDPSTRDSNTIRITIWNSTCGPIEIRQWQVFIASGYWPFRNFTEVSRKPDDDYSNQRIESLEIGDINFQQKSIDIWAETEFHKKKAYIRLHLSGRRPMMRRLENMGRSC